MQLYKCYLILLSASLFFSAMMQHQVTKTVYVKQRYSEHFLESLSLEQMTELICIEKREIKQLPNFKCEDHYNMRASLPRDIDEIDPNDY